MSKDNKKGEKKKCPICGKMLSKNYLKIHIKNIHGSKDTDKKENGVKVKYGIMSHAYQYNNGMRNVNDEEINDLVDWNNLTGDDLREFEKQLECLNIGNNNNDDRNKRQSKRRGKKHIVEEDVQKKLEKKYGCGHQNTPAGIIDILDTKNHMIIEVKHWKGWHHAMGQLFAYQYYYPKYMLKAHFFGPIPSEEKKIVILTVLAHHKIAVSWEKN